MVFALGWRINKHYYLIGSKGDGFKSKRILTWVIVLLIGNTNSSTTLD